MNLPYPTPHTQPCKSHLTLCLSCYKNNSIQCSWLLAYNRSFHLPPGQVQKTMQSSGHRFRDVEHHPLLTENDSYDSSSSEADMADRVWFIRDGCGMVCAIMTWLLVVYADFVVTFVMLLPSKDFWYSVINGVLFNCLAVLALSSHLRTMLTDPVSMQLFLDIQCNCLVSCRE